MKTPFIYGKLATGNYFTDRKEEIEHLKEYFIHGTNTILISPRRWGKSSLINKAVYELQKSNKAIKVVQLDMFNMRTEEDFYKLLSEGVLAAVSGKFDDLVMNARKFLKQWIPTITYSPDAQQEVSIGLNWNAISKDPNEILNLAENIAKDKKIKIVICVDEFQNISHFSDPLAFQKKIRSHWQRHQHVSYCLYGSKRHMLMDVFTSPSMPLYKFGSLIFLEKIPAKYWQSFIQKRFKATAKSITKKQSLQIADYASNHPYYVQQLAQACWLRTDKKLSDETIEEALESLVLQLSLLFQNITESLSTTQVNFLEAVCKGETMYSAKSTLDAYKLGSSANVNKIKKALIKKEIIDEQMGRIEILDPIYTIWLKEYYFVN